MSMQRRPDARIDRANRLIKIGFDGRQIGRTSKDGTSNRPIPIKVEGFVITMNSRGGVGKHGQIVDLDSMRDLGYTRDDVLALMRGDEIEKGRPKEFVRELRVMLTSDAVMQDGQWTFPGMFDDELVLFRGHKNDPVGLVPFCRGDGCHARRLQDDGTVKRVPCVPWWSTEDQNEACTYSREGLCKYPTSELHVTPFIVKDGRPCPLGRVGWGMIAKVKSSAREFGPRVRAALVEAADACDGHIRRLTGTLTYSRRNALHKGRGGGVETGSVQQIYFTIDPESIAARQVQLLHDAERYKAIEMGRAPLALDAPREPAVHHDQPEDHEDPITVDVAMDDEESFDGEVEPEPDADPVQEAPADELPMANDPPPFPFETELTRKWNAHIESLQTKCEEQGRDLDAERTIAEAARDAGVAIADFKAAMKGFANPTAMARKDPKKFQSLIDGWKNTKQE